MSKTTVRLANISQHGFMLYFTFLFLLTFIGLFIPIMDVDATQYASISLELLHSDSFIQFTDLGKDYLDKPPLLFWVSSFFIALLGNTTFAFKIGSFIMAWASVYFLYRLSALYYLKSIAKLSAIIYSSSVAFILFTNDIRTDTLLISFVILAVWQLALYLKNYKTKHIVIGASAIGLALLAKGPLGLMVPLLALLPHLFLTRNFKALYSYKLLFVPIIILVILSPMIIGLYQQFGTHGIRFFFWEQSFGRITGENIWKNNTTQFYFLHNIAWAFIPFTLFFVLAFIKRLIHFTNQKEYISFFGFTLPFIALSLSQYKLPHYIYITIPFAAIFTASYVHSFLQSRTSKIEQVFIFSLQPIVIFALVILPFALAYAFSAPIWLYSVIITLLLIIIYYTIAQENRNFSLMFSSIGSFLLAVFILNSFAYPSLLTYQSSYTAAKYINEQHIIKENLFQLNIYSRGFYYYTGGLVPSYNQTTSKKNSFVFTDKKGKELLQKNSEIEIVKEFNNFSVTRLSLLFLNPKTREKTLEKHYLIKI